jgi:hypothetical protein
MNIALPRYIALLSIALLSIALISIALLFPAPAFPNPGTESLAVRKPPPPAPSGGNCTAPPLPGLQVSGSSA